MAASSDCFNSRGKTRCQGRVDHPATSSNHPAPLPPTARLQLGLSIASICPWKSEAFRRADTDQHFCIRKTGLEESDDGALSINISFTSILVLNEAMSGALDPKLELCLRFVLRQYDHFVEASKVHAGLDAANCFVLGITGCQGCGKTTMATDLARTLSAEPHRLPTLTCSIDQFYLTHKAQAELARAHPSNCLIQHRGQPSTHDLLLAADVLGALRRGAPIKVPSFDKSAFQGSGERDPVKTWKAVNTQPAERIKILILEGWCLGFTAIPASSLVQEWDNAIKSSVRDENRSRKAECKLSSLSFINSALKSYDALNSMLECLIHFDAQDPRFVYDWRLQQEQSLWKTRKAGMSEEEVINFVNNYYSAYELYTEHLRSGSGRSYRRFRLVLDIKRELVSASEM